MRAFRRSAEKYLTNWKKSPYRKPLILRGARQVGKTTLVQHFAETYPNKILLNLEKEADRSHFRKHDNVETLVDSLFLSHQLSRDSIGETLLFLDEIQASPKAIQMLRYFYEDLPELHVIAAGSLLEFAMRKVSSFPVGRVEYLYLHPLNFAEYLDAIGHQAALEQLETVPLQAFASQTLSELFHQYAILGGMPEVVSRFLEKESFTDLPTVYESIWGAYRDDVEKYASNETQRKVIKHLMNTAHLYLDRRLTYQNFGNSNYRSREVREAFQQLEDAKIIQIISPTTEVEIPIIPNLRKSPRLQFLDTGLVNHALGIQAGMLGLSDLSQAYKGAIVPHLITQELISLQTIKYQKPNFWVREKNQASAEVDLVFPFQDKIIPIEIKSGKAGTLRSLHQFIDQTNHSFAVRIYGGEFRIESAKTPAGTPYHLMNLPYYLGTKIPEYVAFFLSQYQ